MQAVDAIDAVALLKKEGLEVLEPLIPSYRIIPFGIATIDNEILGIGGIPGKKMTNIWGEPGAGKTTLIYRLIAMAQKLWPDQFVVLFDSERAYNREWARDAGIDVDRLQVIQDNDATAVFERLLKYARSGACSLICLDSLANLVTATLSSGKVVPGDFAREVKAFTRRINKLIFDNDVALVSSNHAVTKIGVMFGDPDDYAGGRGYKYNVQLSLRVRNAGWITTEPEGRGDKIGVKVAITVDRNKMAIPRKTTENTHAMMYFKDGIAKSRVYSAFDEAIRAGVLQVGGSGNYSLVDPDGGEIVWKGRGKDNVIQEMLEDDELVEQFETLTAKSGSGVSPEVFANTEDSELLDEDAAA